MERSIEGGSSRSVGAETMLVDLNDRIRLISKPSCGFSKCDNWYESGADCALLGASKLRNRRMMRRNDADIMTDVGLRLATALCVVHWLGPLGSYFAEGNLPCQSSF